MAEKQVSIKTTTAQGPARPTISLPPRPSMETLFTGGFSPGPMTLVSTFFSDNYADSGGCGSFSQLLAGAMASPLARPCFFPENPIPNSANHASSAKEDGGESNTNLGFKQSRPMNLMVARSPLFTVPPGLSPSGLLNSPGFFCPQSPFGMSHQQALAQVTAQAALATQSHFHMQSQYQHALTSAPTDVLTHRPFSAPDEASQQKMALPSSHHQSVVEPSDSSHSDKKYQPPVAVDKPSDDGYNWRKYGQKPIKGSEYPRSYYKCTHANCPVKKKVERSCDGQITEIIYKGQHNHEMPQPNKRAKDNNDLNVTTNSHAKPELASKVSAGYINKSTEMVPAHLAHRKDQESNQADPTELPGSSDSEEASDPAKGGHGGGDEPDPKRRNTNSGTSEVALSHKAVTEPKIVVQTRSEVDLLDDGYRWRKYGQKVVKGNPHPRSYYKCTSVGCNVRKHVERAPADPKAVITTYEGKHNHDVPAARHSSHNNAQLSKPQSVAAEKHPLLKGMDFGNNDQRPILLQLKEEEIVV